MKPQKKCVKSLSVAERFLMSSTRETVNSIITDAEKISHCLSKPLEKKFQ